MNREAQPERNENENKMRYHFTAPGWKKLKCLKILCCEQREVSYVLVKHKLVKGLWRAFRPYLVELVFLLYY